MKNYFRLFGYCYLILGENNYCIYDTNTGNMISINKSNADLLKACEENIKLSNLDDDVNCDYEFLNKLENMQMGEYYDKPVYIEKFISSLSKEMSKIIMPSIKIKNAQIEITANCNFNCKFCKKDDNVLYRKTGCKRWLNSALKMSFEDWKKVINELACLGCDEITIIGGEPFLEYEMLKNIVEYSISQNIKNFTVYTNGTVINDEMINFIQENKIKLVIQILSINKSNYDKISCVSTAYDEVMNTMKKLKELLIDFSVLFILNRFNEDEIDLIKPHISVYTNKINFDYIYPKPDNNYFSTKLIDRLYNYKSKLINVNLNIFDYLKENNCCYGNKIAITCDGNILPCIMSRTLILGNLLKDKSLLFAFNEEYDNFKNLSKDCIDNCKSCAYRYGCLECRAIEMSASGKLDGLYYCNMKKE